MYRICNYRAISTSWTLFPLTLNSISDLEINLAFSSDHLVSFQSIFKPTNICRQLPAPPPALHQINLFFLPFLLPPSLSLYCLLRTVRIAQPAAAANCLNRTLFRCLGVQDFLFDVLQYICTVVGLCANQYFVPVYSCFFITEYSGSRDTWIIVPCTCNSYIVLDNNTYTHVRKVLFSVQRHLSCSVLLQPDFEM